MTDMTHDEQTAFDWALNQNHNSIAATYARILAKYIQAHTGADLIIAELERRYPNWHRFRDVIEALDYHIAAQNGIIDNLRHDNDLLRSKIEAARIRGIVDE